jgi:formylglycine-generating enzyme required for sulfatase activity
MLYIIEQSKYKLLFLIILAFVFIFDHSHAQEINYDTLILIPAGEFTMGYSDKNCQCYEHPVHKVSLDAFFIDKFEVTNQRFEKFILAGGYCDSNLWTPIGWNFKNILNLTAPKFWDDENFGIKHPDKPVVGISWYEAYAYAKWAGKRLPTESEWERAARGTDKRLYPWGNDKPDETRCNFGYIYGNTLSGSSKIVGSYENGKSPDGLYDMAGNVSEWCNDWYNLNYYSVSPFENPQGPENGEFKSVRGGSWFYFIRFMRVTYRDFAEPSTRSNIIGFRCAKTP